MEAGNLVYSGKKIVIAGACGGMGKSLTAMLAQDGHKLWFLNSSKTLDLLGKCQPAKRICLNV